MPSVTVACKLPHGVELRIFDMQEQPEAVMGGGSRMVKRAVQIGETVRVAGVAHPEGMAPLAPIVGGYALTHNVDLDHWNRWLADNKGSDMVKNRLIFAYEKADKTGDAAKEAVAIRSGQERIDPNKPGRNVKIADEQKPIQTAA